MTVNIYRSPNSVHLTGDTKLHHHFGAILEVLARPLGEHPHIDVLFAGVSGGVRWELSPDTAVALQRLLLTALATLPYLPEMHDAVGDEL